MNKIEQKLLKDVCVILHLFICKMLIYSLDILLDGQNKLSLLILIYSWDILKEHLEIKSNTQLVYYKKNINWINIENF